MPTLPGSSQDFERSSKRIQSEEFYETVTPPLSMTPAASRYNLCRTARSSSTILHVTGLMRPMVPEPPPQRRWAERRLMHLYN